MLKRHIEPQLRAALADTPVVLIHGARQTGKSTIAMAVAEAQAARKYVTLDDATTLAAATSDPAGFLASLDGPIVIDEVQRAVDLFPAIKAQVDRNRKPGRFLLTGSANVLLLPKLSESLAGRIEIITLWPLSQGEIASREERFIDAAFADAVPASPAGKAVDLLERILQGGYPEPRGRKDPARRAAWYASYITTILQRDVRDLSNIEGLSDLPRLLQLLASRTSGLLNFSDLSRSLSIPQTTLKRYFALLEATFMVVTLPAWSSNQGLRLSKSPKIMLADTGLACHLLGIDRTRMEADGHAKGQLLENFVAMELLKQIGWSKTRAKLFHFRTANGREVDLVLEDTAGRLVGVEVKSGSTVTKDDFNGLRALRELAGRKFHRGIVLHNGTETVSFDKHMVAMPIAALWS